MYSSKKEKQKEKKGPTLVKLIKGKKAPNIC
jgi:hypothetical protein